MRGRPPIFAGLVRQLCAEAVWWSRRVFSFSPAICNFRTALVHALWNRYLSRTSSTISVVGSHTTDQRSDAFPIMLSPLYYGQLQLGVVATTPAASDSTIAIGETSDDLLPCEKRSAPSVGCLASSTSRRGGLPGLQTGRDRRPARMRLSPPRPTSPRAAPSATRPRLSLAGEEGIVGSTAIGAARGEDVPDDCIDSVRTCFGIPCPSVIRRTFSFNTSFILFFSR